MNRKIQNFQGLVNYYQFLSTISTSLKKKRHSSKKCSISKSYNSAKNDCKKAVVCVGRKSCRQIFDQRRSSSSIKILKRKQKRKRF